MTTKKKTRGEQTNADLCALLRARNTLLWITTREEQRVERALLSVAAEAKYDLRFWDCASGVTDASGQPVDPNMRDPSGMPDYIRQNAGRCIYVMRDLHKWWDAVVLRGMRSLSRELQSVSPDVARSVVLLTPSSEIPPELAGHATVIEYPLPDREEIRRLLDEVIGALPESIRDKAAPNGSRDAAIDAAVGLTAEEAANCYARSLVTSKRIDPALVSSEKRRVIAREKVLTWHDPDPRGMEGIGGLDLLKEWLTRRRAGFSARARDFGLPPPKGAMLVGVPGCGKSLTAKCIAAAWSMPLLRLDMGALRSKYVGESEQNIRKALQVAETVAPCVLWLDEIEKAMGGATGPQGDGGVAADALGAILSWMQERAGSVFVIATANDVSSLPPELMRKGRFDELFWIDLPTRTERAAILRATLAQFNRSTDEIDVDAVVSCTEGFTGSEIAALIPDALFVAFEDSERALCTADLVEAAGTVAPLAKTASDRIGELRKWAKGRTRPASNPEERTATAARTLDMEE